MEPDSNDFRKRLNNAKLELKKSLRKNYYKILDVAKDADDTDIKKAYKRAALKYHPDKWGQATEEEIERAEKTFKDIGEAYSLLSDPGGPP
ncbi:DnaJ domain-containing protein [Baffinella frigidus]|nr:DnaJ domain-containing protein [Cryptophyta sp. CCMP2293]